MPCAVHRVHSIIPRIFGVAPTTDQVGSDEHPHPRPEAPLQRRVISAQKRLHDLLPSLLAPPLGALPEPIRGISEASHDGRMDLNQTPLVGPATTLPTIVRCSAAAATANHHVLPQPALINHGSRQRRTQK